MKESIEYTGTVKFYNEAKGFGFIKYPKGEIFFHISKVEGEEILKSEDKVRFRTMDSFKGLQAIEVKLDRGAHNVLHY